MNGKDILLFSTNGKDILLLIRLPVIADIY